MKKLKNILSKALLTTLILSMCFSMTIGAADVVDITSAEKFNTGLPANYPQANASNFSASVKNYALEIKSNSEPKAPYIEFNGISQDGITFAENRVDIELLGNAKENLATYSETGTVVGGQTIKHSFSSYKYVQYGDTLDFAENKPAVGGEWTFGDIKLGNAAAGYKVESEMVELPSNNRLVKGGGEKKTGFKSKYAAQFDFKKGKDGDTLENAAKDFVWRAYFNGYHEGSTASNDDENFLEIRVEDVSIGDRKLEANKWYTMRVITDPVSGVSTLFVTEDGGVEWPAIDVSFTPSTYATAKQHNRIGIDNRKGYNSISVDSGVSGFYDNISFYDVEEINPLYLEEAGSGENVDSGVRLGAYYDTDKKQLSTNYMSLLVDKKGETFSSTYNRARISVNYYMNAVANGSKDLELVYKDKDGDEQVKKLSESGQAKANQWATWELELEDIGFNTEGGFNIKLQTPQAASDPTFATHISSVMLERRPVDIDEHEFSNDSKTYKIPLYDGEYEPVRGNSVLSFNMLLPEDEIYKNEDYYNSSAAAIRLSMLAEKKAAEGETSETEAEPYAEIATLEIVNDGETQDVYAIYGEETKVELETGVSLLGKNLTYTIEVDWVDKTYKASIAGDGINISTDSYAIRNKDAVEEPVMGKFLYVQHATTSEATMTVLDNVSFSCEKDADYYPLEEKLNEIIAEKFANQPISAAIENLPLVCPGIESATIEWAVAGTDFTTEYGDNVVTITPICGKEEKDATITVTATAESGVKCPITFTVKIAQHPDYTKLLEEKEALKITSADINNPVGESFTLPAYGTTEDVTVVWGSSDDIDSDENRAAIVVGTEIGNKGYDATVYRGVADTDIVLTATITIGEFSVTKNFAVTVAEHEDHKVLDEALAKLIGFIKPVEEEFALSQSVTVEGDSYPVTWTSKKVNDDDPTTIAIVGDTATVTRPEGGDVSVNLFAQAEYNGFTVKREFLIRVAGLEGVKATLGNAEETAGATITEGGTVYETVNATVPVELPTSETEVRVVAFSLDENGAVIDRQEGTKTVENGEDVFKITNLKKADSGKREYFLWDENGNSIKNNDPTSVTDLKADGKATGIRLNWSDSKDDYGAIGYYEVYRDNNLIAITGSGETTYLDKDVNAGEDHNYKVVPVDKNNLKAKDYNESKSAKIKMCFMDFDTGESYSMTESHPGGDDVNWKIGEIDGITVATPVVNGKAVAVNISSSVIPASDSELTIEIVYYNNGATVKARSSIREVAADGRWKNASKTAEDVIPNDTSKWKTALVRFDNAILAHDSSNSNSGLVVFGDASIETYIRRISIIQTALYE